MITRRLRLPITDHGYFCYSNGFFTTLNDEKKILEHLLKTLVFAHMCDLSKARAASNTIMNGLTVELRVVGDDILYGYEGLSYIGDYQRVVINSYNLETVFKVGDHFIVIRNPEEVKYDVLYDHGTYRITCKDHMHGTKVGFHQSKSDNRYMFFDGNLYKKI
jgi:hypothetical protein